MGAQFTSQTVIQKSRLVIYSKKKLFQDIATAVGHESGLELGLKPSVVSRRFLYWFGLVSVLDNGLTKYGLGRNREL